MYLKKTHAFEFHFFHEGKTLKLDIGKVLIGMQYIMFEMHIFYFGFHMYYSGKA